MSSAGIALACTKYFPGVSGVLRVTAKESAPEGASANGNSSETTSLPAGVAK